MKIIPLLALTTALLACSKSDEFPHDIPAGAKVIIIGAGASGLYAGKILKENKVDFTILEASDKIGGRLKKDSDFTDFTLDLGAEWIHGKKSLTYKWAEENGVEIYKDNSPGGTWYNNQFYDEANTPEYLTLIFDYISDESQSTPDESLKDWAIGQNYGEDTYDLLEAFSGDFGASSSKLSMTQTAIGLEGWSSGKGDYKFKNQSYYDLIYNTLVPGIKNNIILNSPVTKINYKGDKIIVSAGDTTYEADRVIITVSVNVLKSNLIEFVPELPAAKRMAISKIGMEAGMKVYLKFDTDFFKNKDILGASIGSTYYDAAYGKNSTQPTLGAFVMGEKAQTLSDMDQNAAIQSIIADLDVIHNGQASLHFTGEFIIQDWTKEPYILGAYSYNTVGIGNARSILAETINNKLFLAGEATHLNGHYQTVQGALETGKREAENVIRSF